MDVKQVQSDTDLEILKNLLQAYEAEFCAITKKVPNKKGLFELDINLSKTENFILYVDESPVGFCVKGISEGRHDIYEFYIVPAKRHRRIGRNFAMHVFSTYKGSWQVRQIKGADKAISFWRKAIGEFTNGEFEESVVNDEYWGKVTRQTFESR